MTPQRSAADRPTVNHDPDPAPETRLPGQPPGGTAPPAAIPGHTVLGEVARGGMGAVLRAEDTRLGRELAVKVLLDKYHGDATATARFVAEAKLQGRLQHPGIVPVHELGEYGPGRPFFSMKLVGGRTLAELLAGINPAARPGPDEPPGLSRRSDLPRFVQLFEQVCQALAYAHAQGVIHRDLKPGNVMVGAFGEVQVMDWGLAKHLGATAAPGELPREAGTNPTATVDFRPEPPAPGTHAGAVLGTPAYMAPEQARGEIERLDARADVFALGAILCEILTGRPPYPGPGVLDMVVQAQEADLADAAARLDGCGAEAALVALCKACLAAEPDRRPADGKAVADAVAAYQAAVQERLTAARVAQAATAERLRGERRARRLLGGLAAVLLAGLTAVAALAWVAESQRQAAAAAEADAHSQRQAARQAEGEARAQAAVAEQRRQQAETNLAYATKANAILGSVFTGLDPKARYETVADLRAALKAHLTRAVEELDGAAIGDPLVVAQMQDTLGLSLLGLGEVEQAVTLLQKCRATLAARRGADHPDTLTATNNLALAYRAAGKVDQALPLFAEALRGQKALLGADHPDTLTTTNNLAAAYKDAGKVDLALPLFEEAFRLMKARLGAEHPHTLNCMGGLAAAYKDAGKVDLALPLFEEALRLMKAKLGAEHPDTIATQNNLALCFQAAGRVDLALPLFEETLRLHKARLGADHPHTLTALNNLAAGYKATGKPAQALPLFEEAFRLQKARLGADHPDTLLTMNNLAVCHWSLRQLDQAVPLFEQLLPLREQKLGRGHPSTQSTVANLGVSYKDTGRLAEALPLLEEAYRASARIPALRGVAGPLLDAYGKAGKAAEAARLVAALLADARRTLPPASPQLAGALAQYGSTLLDVGAYAEAEPLLRECLALRAQTQPDAWTTFNTMALLGGALLGRRQYAAAEPLLLKGYAGLKAREQALPPQAKARLPEAVGRLVDLYEATGRPAEAAKWRALLPDRGLTRTLAWPLLWGWPRP